MSLYRDKPDESEYKFKAVCIKTYSLPKYDISIGQIIYEQMYELHKEYHMIKKSTHYMIQTGSWGNRIYYDPVQFDVFDEHFVTLDEWRNIKIEILVN